MMAGSSGARSGCMVSVIGRGFSVLQLDRAGAKTYAISRTEIMAIELTGMVYQHGLDNPGSPFCG